MPAKDFIRFEDRASDHPFIEKVWRCQSERGGRFLSIAANNFEIVVSRLQGKSFLTLRGPETVPTVLDCPPEGEWIAIRFKGGAFMPAFLPGDLSDRRDVTLPAAARHSFWLHGSALDYPDFDNAETFVARLVDSGIIVRDSIVGDTLRRQPNRYLGERSLRSTQRHFLRSTGLTFAALRQIERARAATLLLREGVPILDVVSTAGYFDQAHLTRSLRRFIGQTPVEIMQRQQQLSFLYKTRS